MKTLWENVLKHISTRMNPSSFQTWFAPTRQASFEDRLLTVAVPDKYFVNWLEEQYRDTIIEILHTLTGQALEIAFVISEVPLSPPISREAFPEASESTISQPAPSVPNVQHDEDPGLNPKYTFDTYVVGGSNQFAHAASVAVAEQPSKAYNPLFIYGGVGLGKTHLMHAIGHTLQDANIPGFRLYYLSSERFMNELINAIRYDTIQQFRDKYRNIDLLLIDDIQFIAGKERTQEEFFHTFNALHNAQKQIVISSDCPPKKIPTLEERLRSRFEWGLIADIQPPDFETKVAILRKKAETEGIELSNEVAMYIATKIKSNIRALEGCLTKIAAHSKFAKQPITMDLARKVLDDILDSTESATAKNITVELIQEIVAGHYKIKTQDMKTSTRLRTIAFPRQVAMYLSRKLTTLSLPSVGKHFGGKDHTTIMYACQKIEALLQNDPNFQQELEHLEQTIRS
ncbi:chromosomal replication initiator protein DnaA [candidate division KSB3 bacterium]|uniref:Chromosomal replication initiator protein DnaA n=1 Tax=candidate division KSB3 bacterium TaxID=2044937 RepID=A0A2G6E9T6_9BACT|nr:MAG: chromosomal replication initiator protein DnaA [candidate division KSB3 bacterium]PIE30896.1 MAG: chromosomal replication initiator protein DnaA [candidate division KSB3 bacterium]